MNDINEISDCTTRQCPICSRLYKVWTTIGADQSCCPNCRLAGWSSTYGYPKYNGPANNSWEYCSTPNEELKPRRLRWTKEKPTVEGMYWCRCIDPCRRIAGPANTMYYTPGCELVEMYDEFAGPIPEPEDAE